MLVRVAGLSDARALAEVRVTSCKAAYRGLSPDSYLDRTQVTDGGARWKEILAEENSQTLVCEQGDSAVGLVSFGASRDDDAKDTTRNQLLRSHGFHSGWCCLSSDNRGRDTVAWGSLSSYHLTLWSMTEGLPKRRGWSYCTCSMGEIEY